MSNNDRGRTRACMAWLACSLALASACADEKIVAVERAGGIMGDAGPAPQDGSAGSFDSGAGGAGGGVGGGVGGSGGTGATEPCREVSAEALPARAQVSSTELDEPVVSTLTITADELYDDFTASCGSVACHGGGDMPLAQSPLPYKFTRSSFDQRPNLGDQALARVLSADPSTVMPPGSGDGSARAENDPLRRLAENLKAWQDSGFADSIEVEVIAPRDPTGELPEDPYLLPLSLAESLTNIGSCIPNPALERDVEEMHRLDAVFANAQELEDLPETLVETDLVSLDSEVLATRGVYSYAPTYTLFSDNASKMRYVRVPVGKAITYRADTDDFDIPPNTRFYKTFLKPVTDADGKLGYRKMETRLIVARPDELQADGSWKPKALRATYAWDQDEQMARLVRDPFRNGEPFADRLCPYVVDERVTRDPIKNPMLARVSETCTYMTKAERDDVASGSIRHYAIPSAQRCDECHMGSSSHSYILGFSPWQVDRRREGEGGVFDHPPSADELSQLQRLIEYGVIRGIEPGEAKLEESQLPRQPRNEHELTAQGYMIGNCAFCHNPHGFPTIQNPLLKPFNMFPDRDRGGIFEFSLERFSPRAKQGVDQLARFPYITPAFGNHPNASSSKTISWNDVTPPVMDGDVSSADYLVDSQVLKLLGPWRSLIWRNVYTPFTYAEDGTIFIHMPRNVPDFDCRAQKIMASWMVSIPSTPKSDTGVEEQPYREIKPGEPGYANALRRAKLRVEEYANSVTGQHCPNTDDTLDPAVLSSPVRLTSTGQEQKLIPAPFDDRTLNSPRLYPNLEPRFDDAVPQRAHFVPVDTTDAPGRWTPRRSNWKSVVVSREVEVSEALSRTIDDINAVHLSPEREAFSLTPLPLGLWHPECTELATDAPTVADLQAEGFDSARRWLFATDPEPLPLDGRIHYQSRGEAVFRAICQNCHGREADSRSPLAITIMELTGGQTRVANFVDGLFGPRSAPGLYAENEFTLDSGATPAEWQARYMLFMTLGGTEAQIPGSVVSLVSKSPFYGQTVQAGRPSTASTANMLQSAAETCERLLNGVRWEIKPGMKLVLENRLNEQLPFVKGNGHYELWESLCGFQNEPIIRVLRVDQGGSSLFYFNDLLYRSRDRSGRPIYPFDHPVGNQLGEIELGIRLDNTLPWCVLRESGARGESAVAAFRDEGIDDAQMPFCPDELFATAYGEEIHRVPADIVADPSSFNAEFRERWTRRGAMNAGIAAYYFLDRWTRGLVEPLPDFDACRN